MSRPPPKTAVSGQGQLVIFFGGVADCRSDSSKNNFFNHWLRYRNVKSDPCSRGISSASIFRAGRFLSARSV
jgi:hypothetical protein